MARVFTGLQNSTDKTIKAIDRKRQREREQILNRAREHAITLSTKLVQRLLDRHIIETSSEQAMRDSFSSAIRAATEMEDFDLQFKIAPLRTLVTDPNFLSLYLTQFIIEDLVNHPKIDDVYGDNMDIYLAVDSVILQLDTLAET